MLHEINNKNTENQHQKDNQTQGIQSVPQPDPQVKLKKPYVRRSFTTAQKVRLLEAFDACENATARGIFLRQEGLYYAAISDWKKALASGKLTGSGKYKPPKHPSQSDQLVREIERLKKQLAQANAILELQKKVSELLGVHILPHEQHEMKS